MQYRQDIQIMRGVAVLFVVLFHLNVPGLASGFLGVDVFFVISGFLMALLYQYGKPMDFYRRRAVRLLPAYFFTVTITVVASAWLTLPTEHVQVVEQGIFASIFSSNIGFWNHNSYFSKAEFNPLLHLWSLGVEIQFYLLVPFIAWLNVKSRLTLLGLFLVSLLGCLVVVAISPKTAFFLVPFRIWQFLLGAAVAYYFTVQGTVRTSRPIFGFIALATLVLFLALIKVDGQVTQPLFGHPGGAAILVTIATGVILACGLPQSFQSSIAGRLLGKVGDWSYSIYLIHFPIIVLCLYQPFSGTLLSPSSSTQVLLIVALIAVFAAVSYSVFERRIGCIRDAGRWSVIVCIASVIGVSLASKSANLWPYTEQERNVLAAFEDRDVYRCGKLARILHPKSLVCEFNSDLPKNSPSILLVGDSHSDSIKSIFVKAAHEHGYKVFFMTSNSPLVGSPGADQVLALSKSINVNSVVLHYSSGNTDKALTSGFIDLARRSELKVVWLLPVPTYDDSVPRMIWDNLSTGADFHPAPKNAEATEIFKKQLTKNGVKTFDSYPVFCANQCDVVDAAMRPFYFDSGHLTLTGAERLRPVFDELMSWLKTNSPGLTL